MATQTESRPARTGAYAAVALLFVSVMMAATEPTPLYSFWAREYGFGAVVTTLVFAIYAVGVLLALLFAGRASDVNGRRPVLIACVALSAASSVLFLLAGGLALLFVARLVSGLSAGIAAATLTATLVDLAGSRRRLASVVPGVVNLGGLGTGPVLGGILAQWTSPPTRIPFWVHLGVLAVTATLALGVAYRDRVDRGGRRLLIAHRPALGLPESGRGTFAAAALGGFTAFALLGLFTALVPTFLGDVVHQHHPAVAGASVSLLLAAAVVTQLSIGRLSSAGAVELGLAVLILGVALLAASLDVASYPLFLVATAMSGIALGAAFAGGLSTALSVAGAGERARVSSLFFLISYVELTIPVIAVGIGVAEAGVLPAFITGGSLLAVFAALALGYLRTHRA